LVLKILFRIILYNSKFLDIKKSRLLNKITVRIAYGTC